MTTNQIHNLKYLGALSTNIGTSLLFSLAFQWDLKGYYIWEKMSNPAFKPSLFMIKSLTHFTFCSSKSLAIVFVARIFRLKSLITW
jgi:hypothetical protein